MSHLILMLELSISTSIFGNPLSLSFSTYLAYKALRVILVSIPVLLFQTIRSACNLPHPNELSLLQLIADSEIEDYTFQPYLGNFSDIY
jgi:hypothetical protein